jgi:AraC-like DNA-binding protein
MGPVTEAESAAVQNFVAFVQIMAGQIAVFGTAELPELCERLADAVPSNLGPVAQRIVGEILAETVCRIESLWAAEPTRSFARRLTTFRLLPIPALKSEIQSYVSEARLRCRVAIHQSGSSDPRVRLALQEIWNRSSDALLSIDDMASTVGISKWYLSRLLRQHTGRCFLDHLHEARMSAATKLLLDPRLAIKETAASVGYSSVGAFDRRFRRQFGSSPKEWRARHQLW